MIRIIKEDIDFDNDFNKFDLGDNNAEWYDGVDIPKECIKGATLLSKEEYEKYRWSIPKIKDIWWLCSAGEHYYAYIIYKGDIYFNATYDKDGGIRPALILNPQASKFKVKDKFEFGGHLFKIISKNLAICNDFIGKGCFREDWKLPDSNVYEKSDVKKVVDDWFNKSYAEYEG